VPGFGPVNSEKLLDWRRSCESRFVFDATKGVPVTARRSLAISILQRQRLLETQIDAAAAEIERIGYKFKLQLDEASRTVVGASAAFDQAAANRKAFDESIGRRKV
jgi:DNA-binding helix-hairpin-helix protein with protein kinase domain